MKNIVSHNFISHSVFHDITFNQLFSHRLHHVLLLKVRFSLPYFPLLHVCWLSVSVFYFNVPSSIFICFRLFSKEVTRTVEISISRGVAVRALLSVWNCTSEVSGGVHFGWLLAWIDMPQKRQPYQVRRWFLKEPRAGTNHFEIHLTRCSASYAVTSCAVGTHLYSPTVYYV